MSASDLKPHHDLLERYGKRRRELLEQGRSLTASDLPLKYLRQQAHFTTPASNYDMALKAVERGSSATERILEKYSISLRELADTLVVPLAAIEEELTGDLQSPLVMVDSEDAQALREDVIQRGRENAIRIFREAEWGHTLRFYRPSGLLLEYCLEDLITVLTEAGRDLPPERYPIDGIIWPKAEHPEQLAFLCDLLSDLEERLGLAPNRIKLEFLVESGWAVAQLPALVKATMPRLAGIIFGIADYSADIGLPLIFNNHPVCDWARAAIVNLAGSVGVPAIDNMTVNYPVPDKRLSDGENHLLLVRRIREVFEDAQHGQQLGMDGKWVGHPLQLFAVRLAYRVAMPEEEIVSELDKIEAYDAAVAAEQGATIIQGVMSDRATDRHARRKLRKAVATGILDPQKGLKLGIVTPEEVRQLGA
ncbi:MAG: aldolase/citrate lyase family protein [bacterium]